MKRKRLFLVASIALLLASCQNQLETKDDSMTYIIASQKGVVFSPSNHWQSYFFIKEKGTNEWSWVNTIYGMKYELGYEYVVEGVFVSPDYYHKQGYLEDISYFTVETLISKTQKTTELPEREMKEVERYLELLNSGQLPYEDTWNSEHYPPNYEDLISQ